jgi:NDP-sugar pyrophosphorylase family protein
MQASASAFAATRDLIDEDVFLTSYGDTLIDADLPALIRTREESGKLGRLLAVPPNYTFNLVASDDEVVVTGFHDVAGSPL